MLTNLPFRETQVGAGKARRPFVPSLDRIDSRLFGRLPPSTSSRPCPAGIRKPLTTADLRPTPPLDGLQPSVPETAGGRTLTCRQAVTALSFCSAPNGTRLPSMSTIELVDPELRDALALWPLPPLTAESLTERRANALDLIGAVPKPNLPDIAPDEIRVESAFAPKPIRVLTYRLVRSDGPLPAV